MAIQGLLLVALSLGFMVFRVYAPRPQRVPGTPLRTIALGLRERMLLQRKNLYALAAILVVGAVGGWLSLPIELVAIVAAYGVLTIPVRYRLTSDGVALNRVVFRPWREFAGYQVGGRQITLDGRPGNRRFVLQLLADHQALALPLVRSYLPPSGAAAHAPAEEPEKGGARRAHTRRRRLQARRS